MVSYKQIQESNALINDENAPRVSVFVGGTSGIGNFTLKALVATGASVKIYLVGRKSSEERMRVFIQELHAINLKAEVIWTEGEISLLAEVKRVCEIIKSKESRVDLLFLTAGYCPFGARRETAEGLEVAQSLAYYSRMLFIAHLLPLLGGAENPRVISVLGGGMERGVDLEDLELKKQGNFGPRKFQMQYITMNTLGLEKLANDVSDVTFIHSWPGLVNTGNIRRGTEPNSVMAWATWLIIEPLFALFAFTGIFGQSHEESGQRHLFLCTSAAFGGRGVSWKGKPGMNTQEKGSDGVFLVNYKCDCTPNAKLISGLRENALGKVWEHTEKVLGQHL